MTNSTRGLLLAGVTALFWGMLAIALKVVLNFFDPYTVVWWRFFMAFVVLFVYFVFRRPAYLKILKRPPGLLLLAGFLLGVNYIGFMQGVNYAGPSVTQVLIQVGPLSLALVGIIFFRERVSPIRVVGFGVALVGFSFFYYQQLQRFVYTADLLNQGVIWILVAAWSWTGYAVLNKLLVQRIPSSQINLILYGVPAVLFFPMADIHSLVSVSSPWVFLLLLFAGANTLIAYGALSLALKYAEANKISIIITLNPVITFALLEMLLWLNVEWFEVPRVGLLAYLGAFVVLTGAILAIGRAPRVNTKRDS